MALALVWRNPLPLIRTRQTVQRIQSTLPQESPCAPRIFLFEPNYRPMGARRWASDRFRGSRGHCSGFDALLSRYELTSQISTAYIHSPTIQFLWPCDCFSPSVGTVGLARR
jgi:hypothetical protein